MQTGSCSSHFRGARLVLGGAVDIPVKVVFIHQVIYIFAKPFLIEVHPGKLMAGTK